ncbi:MAG TPA: hypothetical protein VKE91_02710 [Blastocatellia bacterium]|nr:hypothetical protein [Blastocatellia bacterium]
METGRRGDGETGGKRDREKSLFLRLLVSLSPLLLVFINACGKIGDPLPPIPRAPLKIDELGVEQQGTKLILSFPFTRTARTRLQRVDVYRLIEPTDAPQGLPIETFSEKAHVIYSIPADEIPLNSSKVVYNDTLDMRSELRNKRYRYAIRMFNTAGQAADFSSYAMIEPLFNLSLPPANLNAKQFETRIEITWDQPTGNMNETSPANVAGYNIYRRTGESVYRINPEPLREPRFIDRNFQFGVNYQYIVRSLSFTPGKASLSEAIESNDSQPLDHTPKDTFPPAPPKPVTIASINSIVSLFWPLNAEPDVIGYNIYRTEDENAPPEKWIKLNQELYKTASFRDERVQVGKRYFYQITAIDAYGNESVRSETVSETVAP